MVDIRFTRPISVICFLLAFEIKCDTNHVHKGTALCKYAKFLYEWCPAYAINTILALGTKSYDQWMESAFPFKYEYINHLVEAYATYDIAA